MAFRLRYNGTGMLFRSYEKKDADLSCRREWLYAPEELIERYISETDNLPELAEFDALTELASDYLTQLDCVMFHGVAFVRNQSAYILTAPSGTGKSTQFRNLRHLFGNRYRIICGDKPILKRSEDGNIWTYPSPWNGKEGWGSTKRSGPLRGIIALKQGKENELEILNPDKSVLPVMEQIIYSAPDLETVRKICHFAEQLIQSVPIYSFVNKGDYPSSALLDNLISSLENS